MEVDSVGFLFFKEKILKFEKFPLSKWVLDGIRDMGYVDASPIQQMCIEPLLQGFDLIGQAQTGTGKTAAFGIPMVEMVDVFMGVQALILVPTRELSIQVANELKKIGKYKKDLKILSVHGGSDMRKQLKELKSGVNIVVGTPGRIMDHLRRKTLKLNELRITVLDEADEMFDMGFRDDMKTILDYTDKNRQTCFFSATMGKEIQEFSKLYQKNPVDIRIEKKELTVSKISQFYLETNSKMKTEILTRLIDIYMPKLAMVFCNTKRMVDDLVHELVSYGYKADGLHGDLQQNQRDIVMRKFRNSTIDILIATDVAARGIDVGNVDMVVNYELPQDEEYYVHRIGRTARAGREGLSFSFVTSKDINKLEQIVKYTHATMEKMPLPTIYDLRENSIENIQRKIDSEISDIRQNSQYYEILKNMEKSGKNIHDIAASLIKIVNELQGKNNHKEIEGVDFGKEFKLFRKSDRKIVKNRMFLNKGKKDKLDVNSIIAFLRKEAKINAKFIGDIVIKDNFSFVEVDEPYLDIAIKKTNGKKLKNKKVTVELSQKNNF